MYSARLSSEYHQAILLTRILFIVSFLILRFICFIIGASCSTHYKSQSTAYMIIAAFALTTFAITLIVEFIDFSRLWGYYPTEVITDDRNENRIFIFIEQVVIRKFHRRHLLFIHDLLLNDEHADGFRRSLCHDGENCRSRSLHDHLFYHSLDSERNIETELIDDILNKSSIAFHRTIAQNVYKIVQKGFPYGSHTGPTKDYLHLDKSIFFYTLLF